MRNISRGEAKPRSVSKWAWLAVGAAALVPLGVGEAAPVAASRGADPAVVRASFIEQWMTGKYGCSLNGLFDLGQQGSEDDFSYDPETGIATIQASIMSRNPETGEYEPRLAGPQQPDAYNLANKMQLFTLRFRYDANAQPGFELVPAAPPDSMMIFRLCEITNQLIELRSEWMVPPPPSTLPAPAYQ